MYPWLAHLLEFGPEAIVPAMSKVKVKVKVCTVALVVLKNSSGVVAK